MEGLLQHFNAVVARDFFRLFTKEQLGQGSARAVYSCSIRPDLVIKFEDSSGSFQNIIEWETWRRVQGTKFEEFFAPCEQISPCGTVLLQKRTTPVERDAYPKRLPRFLTDLKRSNYGRLDGRFVCHDYGTNLLMEYGMTNKTNKVEWWE